MERPFYRSIHDHHAALFFRLSRQRSWPRCHPASVFIGALDQYRTDQVEEKAVNYAKDISFKRLVHVYGPAIFLDDLYPGDHLADGLAP
jgi:hypothetical protein